MKSTSKQPEQAIEAVLADITTIEADAIVNAANKTLLGGEGVDAAIHEAAGIQLFGECSHLGGCATGQAKITKGYQLPAKHVIHTVGPMWFDPGYSDEEKDDLLAQCYRNSLQLAEQNRLKSVVFPSISTGAFQFPIERAAPIAIREVHAFLKQSESVKKVIFVLFSQEDLDHYNTLLEQRGL